MAKGAGLRWDGMTGHRPPRCRHRHSPAKFRLAKPLGFRPQSRRPVARTPESRRCHPGRVNERARAFFQRDLPSCLLPRARVQPRRGDAGQRERPERGALGPGFEASGTLAQRTQGVGQRDRLQPGRVAGCQFVRGLVDPNLGRSRWPGNRGASGTVVHASAHVQSRRRVSGCERDPGPVCLYHSRADESKSVWSVTSLEPSASPSIPACPTWPLHPMITQ